MKNDKTKIRAYEVSANVSDYTLVIFASTKNKAKILGLREDTFFEGYSYLELTAKLAPAFEELNDQTEHIVNACEHALFFKQLGHVCGNAKDGSCDDASCCFFKAPHEN